MLSIQANTDYRFYCQRTNSYCILFISFNVNHIFVCLIYSIDSFADIL